MSKVALVGPAYPYRGGIAQFSNHLAYYLSRESDVKVKIFNYRVLYPSIFFPGKTQYDFSKKYFDFDSERILSPINPFSWWRTYKRVKEQGFKIIVIQWWHPFFAPALFLISFMLKRSGIKRIIFLCHNYSSHELGWFWRFLVKPTLRQANLLITLSSFVSEEIERELPNRLVYRAKHPIYTVFIESNGGRIESRKKIGLKEKDKVILFFGYVRSYKGLIDLVSSLPLVIEKVPDLKLVIAGEFYEDIEKYKQLIEEKNLDKKVVIINEYIPNEEVHHYFQAADLLVLPYRSASQSGIIPQAHQFNLPLITTDVGGLADEIIPENGDRLVPAQDIEALAGEIIKFFQESFILKKTNKEPAKATETWRELVDIILRN